MTSGDPPFFGGFPISLWFLFFDWRVFGSWFVVRRSFVTSGDPPFLLFLVDFLFFGGFPVSCFLVLVGFLFPF